MSKSNRNGYLNALRGLYDAICAGYGQRYLNSTFQQRVELRTQAGADMWLTRSTADNWLHDCANRVVRWQVVTDAYLRRAGERAARRARDTERAFNRAIRFVVEALRAFHADRYMTIARFFPGDWTLHYACGAHQRAWLRYARKMLLNWLERRDRAAAEARAEAQVERWINYVTARTH